MKFKHWFFYPLLFLLYAVFSFTRVTPNLVLTSNYRYWEIQLKLWEIGFHQPKTVSILFISSITGIFIAYLLLLHFIKKHQLNFKQLMLIVGASVAVLFASYPALSNDVFNYMFNAKMVWKYQDNPHVATALDYPEDPWVKFMHNIHTPAPYGYGWTALSLIPSYIAQESVNLNLLLFRIFVVAAFFGMIFLMKKVEKASTYDIALFALNPLVLIETVSTIHNDVIMMFLALLSAYFVFKALKKKKWYFWLLALISFAASVSIKYATVAMVGGAALYLIVQKLKLFKLDWATSLSLSLFSPLLTSRSQRFLPWYLIWPLTFIPFSRSRLWRQFMLAFSFSALISYVPYLYEGGYTPQVQLLRQIIVFLPPLAFILTQILVSRLNSLKK